jgi:hypothetical protein
LLAGGRLWCGRGLGLGRSFDLDCFVLLRLRGAVTAVSMGPVARSTLYYTHGAGFAAVAGLSIMNSSSCSLVSRDHVSTPSRAYRVAVVVVVVVARICALIHGLVAAGDALLLLGLFLGFGGRLGGPVKIIVFFVHCSRRLSGEARRAQLIRRCWSLEALWACRRLRKGAMEVCRDLEESCATKVASSW